MPPSAARSHLPREPDTDEVRSITGRITSIHTAADNPHSRQPSFRQTGFSETCSLDSFGICGHCHYRINLMRGCLKKGGSTYGCWCLYGISGRHTGAV
jgi:hypothetical protein